jgi:hypothetical protein
VDVTRVGELAYADGAVPGEEPNRPLRSVGQSDGLVFQVGALDLPAASASVAGSGSSPAGGGDPVDGEQSELAEKPLVMDATQRGVV